MTKEMVALYYEESLLKNPVDIPLPLGDDDNLEEERNAEIEDREDREQETTKKEKGRKSTNLKEWKVDRLQCV